MNKQVTILQDLQGPKLRVGNIPGDSIMLTPGETIVLSSREGGLDGSGKTLIPMDVPDLEQAVAPGGRILMDDGNLELSVINVTAKSVEARVVIGGALKSHKGVNSCPEHT